MKRLVIAIVMWLQVVFIIAYTHFSTDAKLWQWLYFLCDPLFIILMLTSIICLVYFDKLTVMDLQFICVSILFNILRFICYFGNDFYNVFKNTYTFETIGLGIIIATVLIITSAIKHDIFKD